MNFNKYFKIVLLVVGLLFCGLVIVLVTGVGISTGSMISEGKAIELKAEVLDFAKSNSENEIAAKFSALRANKIDNGVLLVFEKKWVEDHGFLYVESESDMPDYYAPYSRKITDGVYSFRDPG